MLAGDTFFLGARSADIHLWVVFSDPSRDPDRVLFASLTTRTPQSDGACPLGRGDHPFLQHATVVDYGRCRVASNGQLDRLRASGKLVTRERVSTEVLRRIQTGACRSDRLPLRFQGVLAAQGLDAI